MATLAYLFDQFKNYYDHLVQTTPQWRNWRIHPGFCAHLRLIAG